jgi:hypothetical protein
MDERRQHPRIPLRAEAEVRFASWEVFRLIYTVNISQGGMQVDMPKEPPAGSELVVKLSLPSGPPLELKATVRHVTASKGRYLVGVQFASLDDQQKDLIERTIRAHAGGGGTIGLTRKKA